MKILILKEGCSVAQDFGFGSAIATLLKGFDKLQQEYTLNPDDDFDVIVANDWECAKTGIELKKKTGKPLIASIHLLHVAFEPEGELLEACDAIIVYSEIGKNAIKHHYPNIKKPIEVVTLGIDTDIWYTSDKAREDFVLFIGRTEAPNKNCINLIEQCLKEDVPFKIAGDLKSVTDPKINLGYLKPNELAEVYQKAKLHILPSTFEPFGLCTLEAMACGCPVAVSTRSGVSEILNESVAILFDPLKPFSVKEFLSKKFDSEEISRFASKFDAMFHARSFQEAVFKILQQDSRRRIVEEINRGDYSRCPFKDKVVLDIGAFMGESAVHFAKLGAKEVIAIEPFSSVKFIETSAREAGMSDKITPIKCAIGRVDDVIRIKDFTNSGESKLWEHLDDNGEELKVVSLNTLIGAVVDNDIVVKMDVEGCESAIFTATTKTLNRVKYFIIEAHDNISPAIGIKIAHFLGFKGFNIQHELHGLDVSMIYAERNDHICLQ